MKHILFNALMLLSFGVIFGQQEIIFEDDFNTESSNWELTPYSKIENGVLVIDNASNLEKTVKANIKFDYSKDFKISYKVKWISGQDNKAIKIKFNKSDDNKNAQIFGFSANGNWIFEYLKNNNWEQSTSWQKTTIIQKKDWNTINIIKFQDKIYVEINEKTILTKNASLFNGENISFSTFGPQIVHFDTLKLTAIKNYTLSEKDTSYILEGEERIHKTEDFSNTNNELKPVLKDDYEINFNNNQLNIDNQTENLSVSEYFNFFYSYKDFKISFESEYLVGNINTYMYGDIYSDKYRLSFGYNKNNTGFFKVLKNKKEVQEGFSSFKTSYLKHNQKNKLKLEKIGTYLFFSINDKLVKKIKINGCYDIGTKFRLGIDNGLTAIFDNLEIKDIYRSIEDQEKRIALLDNQLKIDSKQDELYVKENSALMKAEELKMEEKAKQLQIEYDNIKKVKEAKKDAEIIAKYSDKQNIQPFLNKKYTNFKISLKGTHLLIYNQSHKYITIWDLNSLQQVHHYQFKNINFIKAYYELADLEFDWNTTTNLPSVVGRTKINSGNGDYFWYDGKKLHYGASTGLNSDFGHIEHVYENEALTTIRKIFRKKDGSYDKPKYLQLQFYNFYLKKWRTYKFEKAINVKISNAYKRAFIYYEDKMEVYSFSENFSKHTLIKTFNKPTFNRFFIDPMHPNIIRLSLVKKYKTKAEKFYDMSKDEFVAPIKLNVNNQYLNGENIYNSTPIITFEDIVSDDKELQKIKLTHNDKSVYLTAQKKALSKLIDKKLDEYVSKTKAIEKEIEEKTASENLEKTSQLMGRLKQFGTSYKFSYSNFDFVQIGNNSLIKENGLGGDLKAIGKFCDNTSGHFGSTKVLAVQVSKKSVGEQYVFKLLSFSDYGVTAETLGVTQKVRGKVTQLANLELYKSGSGYNIYVNTDGRKKTFNVKSKCR